MQMVDTITDISNTHVVTEFEVKSTCIFVEEGKFAEVGLIENMAQELFALPKVQEVVRTEAELLSRFDSDEYYLCAMRCNAFADGVHLATAELNLVIKNLTE